ncbi:MAG: sugar transferase [Acetobacteraceae bacterium]
MVPFAVDLLVILVTGLAASWFPALRTGDFEISVIQAAQPSPARVLIILSCVVLYLILRGRYSYRIPPFQEFQATGAAVLYAMLVDIALTAADHDIPSRVPDLVALSALPILMTAASRVSRYALLRSGAWYISVLAVGDGPGAVAAEAGLMSHSGLGYQLAGRIDPSIVASSLGKHTLKSILDQHNAERLVIAVGGRNEIVCRLLETAMQERIPFAVSVSAPGRHDTGCHLASLAGWDPLILWARGSSFRSLQLAAKPVMDVMLAFMILSLITPLLLVIAFITRLDGGPALFSHRRLGFRGRQFYCLKFRTMVVDAERVLQNTLADHPALAAEWNETHKLKRDPRVTRLGAFLRRTSLDELPQLINVLRLQMSLVGPRPITDTEVLHYGNDISYYYAMRPGITGLWQVSGRSNTTYERRVRLDVQYARDWSLWRDITVLFKTIPAVLAREGAY